MSEKERVESTRVEELLRVNAALAAELRDLAQGRADKPRPAAATAARGVARLLAERDALARRLEETETTLAATESERNQLERVNHELALEVARLRSGFAGLLRRARGRLLNRGADGAAPGRRGR